MNNILEYDKNKLTYEELDYVQSTIELAAANNFTVRLINKPFVKFGDESKVNGFVSDDTHEKILSVATGKAKAKWFQTFIHESCHMDQSIEKARVWKDLKVGESAEAPDLVFMWLDHIIELNKDQLSRYIQKSLMVELDCEKRSAKKIVDYNLPHDVQEYTQRANAYVYFYLMVQRTRKWYKIGREPYNTKAVWSQMPNHFFNDYTTIPTKYVKLYKEHCFK